MPALEIENLSTEIELSRSVVHAVGNVDLKIEAGETLGLVGESGCGKSMLGLSILNLLPGGGKIIEGSIRVGGQELVGLRESELQRVRGNKVAMIFQDSQSSLNPTKTIGAQVAEPVRLHRGASKKEALDRAIEVLELVGLPQPRERLRDFPHQLSGGLRQRVMIAIALSCEPEVLIADEPTTALDVTIQAQILSVLDELKQRLGMATLLVTHDMGVVAGRADRVNVMYAGRIVETADTGELFTRMHHPYTQALFGSIPRLDQDNKRALVTVPGLPPDLSNPPPGCRFAPRCPRATEKCVAAEPPLAGPDPQHLFACWHPVDGPAQRAPDIEVRERPVGGEVERVGQVGAGDVERDRQAVAAGGAPKRGGRGDASDLARHVGALLEVRNVVREYPVTAGAILQRKVNSVKAVSDITLHVGKGETLGLVGESGCGKTTLGKLIVGIERPDAGKIELEGRETLAYRGRALRAARRDLQMMFQDPYASLDPRMRVRSILREPLVIQKIGRRREQDERIANLLGEVGLPLQALERFPHEFSGGQRQRIGLARALMLNPKVLVADEPVSALDVSIRSQVLNLMKRLQAEHGTATLVISHDLAVVKYLSDRIGVMYLGKLVEIGDGDAIYRRAAHPYTAALIETIPLPDPAAERAKSTVAIRGELPSPVNPPSGCRFRTRCPRAKEKCAELEPPLRKFGPGHEAACHFPLQEPLEPEEIENEPAAQAPENPAAPSVA